MALFEKKFCSVCGQKIGLLGNRKLSDGNLCKDCASKLSPWFSERRSSSVAEIQAQLAYREANRQKVASFHTTRTLGGSTKVLLDEDSKQFMVVRTSNIAEENPDVLAFSDVTGCQLDIREQKTEIKHKDAEGKEVSFNPRRYSYEYNFYIDIFVNHPYFNQINFRLNNSNIDGKSRGEYDNYKSMGDSIVNALTQVRQEVRDDIAAANAPKQAVTCPWCGATTLPDANGCCEYCGSSVNG